jgi:hypothetical protein
MPTEEKPAIEVGADRRGRWLSAAWWGGLVLVAAVVVARLGGHGQVVLVLGVVVAALVVLAAVRERPVVVTADQVRHPKRTIRRADVARITGSGESTALVFHGADGGVVGIVDVFGRTGALRDALRAQGWPEVDASA